MGFSQFDGWFQTRREAGTTGPAPEQVLKVDSKRSCSRRQLLDAVNRQEETIQQGLRPRRASRHIDIHGHDVSDSP